MAKPPAQVRVWLAGCLHDGQWRPWPLRPPLPASSDRRRRVAAARRSGRGRRCVVGVGATGDLTVRSAPASGDASAPRRDRLVTSGGLNAGTPVGRDSRKRPSVSTVAPLGDQGSVSGTSGAERCCRPTERMALAATGMPQAATSAASALRHRRATRTRRMRKAFHMTDSADRKSKGRVKFRSAKSKDAAGASRPSQGVWPRSRCARPQGVRWTGGAGSRVTSCASPRPFGRGALGPCGHNAFPDVRCGPIRRCADCPRCHAGSRCPGGYPCTRWGMALPGS